MTYNLAVTQNKNPLILSGGFKMVLGRAPNTTYFLKAWQLPTMTVTETQITRPQTDVFVPGSKIVYDPLSVSMLISEDMENYVEIYSWLRECVLGAQENGAERKKESDIIIQILNSKNNVHKEVVFHNAFPTAIGTIDWNVEDSDVTYASVDVMFRYDYFTIK